MTRLQPKASPRRATDVSLGSALAEERARHWKEENREAMESLNRYIEEHGLPLEDYRLF